MQGLREKKTQREMDRVFSVDEMADQFWSPQPPSNRLDLQEKDDEEQSSSSATAASSSSSKAMKMNRSPSEWAFQRFLQEVAAPNHSSASSMNLQNADVVEIEDNIHHSNQNEFNNGNSNQHRRIAAETAAVAGGSLQPAIPVNSDEYQAFLKSRLELACAAVAFTRVLLFISIIQLFNFPFSYKKKNGALWSFLCDVLDTFSACFSWN